MLFSETPFFQFMKWCWLNRIEWWSAEERNQDGGRTMCGLLPAASASDPNNEASKGAQSARGLRYWYNFCFRSGVVGGALRGGAGTRTHTHTPIPTSPEFSFQFPSAARKIVSHFSHQSEWVTNVQGFWDFPLNTCVWLHFLLFS